MQALSRYNERVVVEIITSSRYQLLETQLFSRSYEKWSKIALKKESKILFPFSKRDFLKEV